jgi:hypothetical protein
LVLISQRRFQAGAMPGVKPTGNDTNGRPGDRFQGQTGSDAPVLGKPDRNQF